MILCFLSMLFVVQSSFAAPFQSEISGVSPSQNQKEDHLVFFTKEGTVGFLRQGNQKDQKKLLSLLEAGVKNHTRFEAELDAQHRILQIKNLVARPDSPAPDSRTFKKKINEPYQPTILLDFNAAKQIFNELNPHARKRSECYNRAQVWSYEEKQKRNLNSMKVFLFFTSKYIREYHYKWWFHVTPFVLIENFFQNSSTTVGTTEQVIDYAFMNKPTFMQDWTNYFIIPHTQCPTVEKYSDYSKHQEEHNCYLIKKSMYFWQPADIEALENTGNEKTDFISDEVSAAYRQGF